MAHTQYVYSAESCIVNIYEETCQKEKFIHSVNFKNCIDVHIICNSL